MTGSLALSPLELIYRMSMYTAVQSIIAGALAGEFYMFDGSARRVNTADEQSKLPTIAICAFLFGNGLVALFLNIASFQATKVAGSLAVTVWGNIRQTLVLAWGIAVLGDFQLDIKSGTGIMLVVVGCVLYNKSELDAKRQAEEDR